MNTPFDTFVNYGAFMMIYLAVPFVWILLPVIPTRFKLMKPRSTGKVVLITTLVMWPLILVHHACIAAPYEMTRSSDYGYDGVGGFVGLMLFGWLIALMFETPHLIARLMIQKFLRRRNRRDPLLEPPHHIKLP